MALFPFSRNLKEGMEMKTKAFQFVIEVEIPESSCQGKDPTSDFWFKSIEKYIKQRANEFNFKIQSSNVHGF